MQDVIGQYLSWAEGVDYQSSCMLYVLGGGCRHPDGMGSCKANTYLHSGFAALQAAIDTVLIRVYKQNIYFFAMKDAHLNLMDAFL